MIRKSQRNNFSGYEIFFMLFDKILYNVNLFEFFVFSRKFCPSSNICFFKFSFDSMSFWIYSIIAVYHFCSSISFIIALKERILLAEIHFIKFDFLNMTFNTTASDSLRHLIFKLYSKNSDIHLINCLNKFFFVFKYYKFW